MIARDAKASARYVPIKTIEPDPPWLAAMRTFAVSKLDVAKDRKSF